jgi:hypothetical protein
VTNIRRCETTGRPVFIITVHHLWIPKPKNLVGQVAPQALLDLRKFLFQSDRPVFFGGGWLLG